MRIYRLYETQNLESRQDGRKKWSSDKVPLQIDIIQKTLSKIRYKKRRGREQRESWVNFLLSYNEKGQKYDYYMA